jgi:hypothetical protein
MAKKKRGEDNGAVDVDEQQPALVPMSAAEVKDAGRKLAAKVRELEDLELEHKELREEQRAERKTLKEAISAIARTVRQQGR